MLGFVSCVGKTSSPFVCFGRLHFGFPGQRRRPLTQLSHISQSLTSFSWCQFIWSGIVMKGILSGVLCAKRRLWRAEGKWGSQVQCDVFWERFSR